MPTLSEGVPLHFQVVPPAVAKHEDSKALGSVAALAYLRSKCGLIASHLEAAVESYDAKEPLEPFWNDAVRLKLRSKRTAIPRICFCT